MAKTIEQLEQNACKYWPKEILESVAKVNTIPFLLETQEPFLSILKYADASPTNWVDVLSGHPTLTANVFLKHLSVMTDIGGERLQRFSKDFSSLFPTGKLEFLWREKNFTYTFSTRTPHWTNKNLCIDKDTLSLDCKLSNELKDVIMLLLWGGLAINNSNIPDELRQKCIIGNLIGKPALLDEFVKQRYIYVSRITGGSTANDCGHICEDSCVSRLKSFLPNTYVIGGHSISGITQNNKKETTFELLFPILKQNVHVQ